MKYIIFTDMDGTLIDHDTYSYKEAEDALQLIKENNIPLIFCTSKTRKEIETFCNKMEVNHPFISENGGAIYIPKNYFTAEYDYDIEYEGYNVIELGTRYNILRNVLKDIQNALETEIVGFGDLDATQISQLTGLDIKSAENASVREYDEAFTIKIQDEQNIDVNQIIDIITSKITSSGLTYTKGGRFWHIMGDNDKGKAVAILTDIYQKELGNVKTIGLGDSLNDLPMLHSVDIPILVQKPTGSHDPEITDSSINYIDGIGPVGWNKAITNILIKDS